MCAFASPFQAYPMPEAPIERQDQPFSYQERQRFAEGWTLRRIKQKPTRNVSITQADREAGQEKVREMRSLEQNNLMHNVPLLAERLFLEAADIDGGISGHGSRWFGDATTTYFTNHYDDLLRGSDALLFVFDKQNERVAYPLAIDITVSSQDVMRKIYADIHTLKQTEPKLLYWYDTFTHDAQIKALDTPKEGRILAPHVTVLLPDSIVRQFFHPMTPAQQAKTLMQELGPAVMIQIQKQLELQAAILLGELSEDDIRHRTLYMRSVQDRPQLRARMQQVLDDPASTLTPQQKQYLSHIAHALETIWERRDHYDRVSKRQAIPRRFIPEMLDRFPNLPASSPEPAQAA